MGKYKKIVEKMLKQVDIEINGNRPFDIQVENFQLYKRVLQQGSLGFGEAYMDGWWNSEQLDELIKRLLEKDLDEMVKNNFSSLLLVIFSRLFNLQNSARAFKIGEAHYDVGNDLYKAMLDRRMVYTCGYWKNAKNLDEAQEAKLDLVCRKIGLKSGQTVLDIGCGWGSFAKFAAEKYGVKVVGVTVSKEQKRLGDELCKGLPVEIRLQDYRNIKGDFDHIISLGMFEHVGPKNYTDFFRVVRNSLKDEGLFLLHTIGGNKSVQSTDPWIDKYIFPGGVLPSIKQIAEAMENKLVMEDWHNFGTDYDKTLMAWFDNFDKAWSKLKNKYDDRFYRMWKFYLLSCAGTFRARKIQLWQIVFSKEGLKNGYNSIR